MVGSERVLDQRLAAARIQAIVRSYLARRRLRHQQDAAQRIQAMVRGMLDRRRAAELARERERRRRFQDVMRRNEERARVRLQEAHVLRAIPATELEKYEEKRRAAATKVQAQWRGRMARDAFRKRQPELDRRHVAASRIQAAFRESSNSPIKQAERRRRELDEAREVMESLGDVPLRGSVVQLPELTETGSLVISEARSEQLRKQVEQKAKLMKAAKSVAQTPAESLHLDRKLRALLEERERLQGHRRREMEERAHVRSQAAIAFNNLERKHTALADIPASAEPHDFVLPPRDSKRMARARHGHAAMLAQEKAGTHWWRHLSALNEFEEELDDNWTVWDEMDNSRHARWARILHEEQVRGASLDLENKGQAAAPRTEP